MVQWPSKTLHNQMMIWPGRSIMLVVFSLNMFGEGLNEALMPGGNKKAKQLGDGE